VITTLDCTLTFLELPLFDETRPFRILRIYLIVSDSRQLRSNAMYLFHMIPTLFGILITYLVYIVIFSIIALVCFDKETLQGGKIETFDDLMATLFATLTTVNWPDISFPMLRKHSYSSTFWVTFIVVGGIYMQNLVLAQGELSMQQFLIPFSVLHIQKALRD